MPVVARHCGIAVNCHGQLLQSMIWGHVWRAVPDAMRGCRLRRHLIVLMLKMMRLLLLLLLLLWWPLNPQIDNDENQRARFG